MPRSLARGDYSLLMAVESASRPDVWYRVVADRQTRTISCDCGTWTFNRRGNRTCPHTDFVAPLVMTRQGETPLVPIQTTMDSPLIAATQRQWPGLSGQWGIEEGRGTINDNAYHIVLLRLSLGNGGTANGCIAFADRHSPTQERICSRVAGWAGYALAAEVARLGGYPMAGQPPEHFRVTSRASRRSGVRQEHPTAPQIGLLDILSLADQVDLGDGLRPAERAENTLRFFLGEALYAQLERNHFLDVSSVRFVHDQRVYRLRRDPNKARERRVRVFERGRYTRDLCIIRGQDVPEGDFFLTNFLSFLSDELAAISVVQSYNVFPPRSDGSEEETIPAYWQAREAVGVSSRGLDT